MPFEIPSFLYQVDFESCGVVRMGSSVECCKCIKPIRFDELSPDQRALVHKNIAYLRWSGPITRLPLLITPPPLFDQGKGDIQQVFDTVFGSSKFVDEVDGCLDPRQLFNYGNV